MYAYMLAVYSVMEHSRKNRKAKKKEEEEGEKKECLLNPIPPSYLFSFSLHIHTRNFLIVQNNENLELYNICSV